jgi:uncharacterized tellurite resistance protein B-like protein
MLGTIRQFFENQLFSKEQESDNERVCRLQLASAALMFELLKIDRHIDERETRKLQEILTERFSLPPQQLQEIIDLAEAESAAAVCLYEFTSLVNEHYRYDEKVQLIRNLWDLAMADDHLDKYEEQMIRRTADLIYVTHSDFIKTKLAARAAGGAAN